MNRSVWPAWMFLLVFGCLTVWAPSARSDANRGWYLNGGVGLNHIDTMKGADELDLGFRLVAAGGFRFNRIVALEFDSGLVRNTFSKSKDPVSRKYPITQVPLVLNGVVSIPNRSMLEPYLGAGAGVVLVGRSGTSGGDVCLAVKGGLRYGLNERMAIGADYTYFMYGAISAIVGEPLGNDTFNLGVHWKY